MTLRRGLTVAITVIAAASIGAAPAAATPTPSDTQPPFASGSGSVGRAEGFINGRSFAIQPLAECRVGFQRSGQTFGVQVGNIFGFGRGESRCEGGFGRQSVEVRGTNFRLGSWDQWGGRARVQLQDFSLSCESDRRGSRTSFRLSGLFLDRWVQIPRQVPPNYTVWLRNQRGVPVAKVVLNEVMRSWPPTGGVSVNLMHIWLLPTAPTVNRGEFVIGSVSCSPRR
ncbi:choice-of-anchor P family protein [Actinophytocola sp.]|uniref:choice-of-anchor P family protein n=1 Tax=Actinophytocola sp. TaxID=1872138 RepID=UPI002D7E6556|nr:choice-of-anchor P family protein [Actinophytocola sp.]HET9138095.1 choice-of-anchor P family protein [Actinophytocola sp.]